MEQQQILKMDQEAAEIIKVGIDVLRDSGEHLSILSIYNHVAEELRKTGHNEELFAHFRQIRQGIDLSNERI